MTLLTIANPLAAYRAQQAEIDAAMRRVLEGGQYVLGDAVTAFERDFAGWIGAAHGVGVGSGTDALHLGLRALELAPGDEVIVPSLTAVATVAAIEMAGAVPVLADVEPRFHTLAPAAVAPLVGPRTRAIVAVHLYGQPADVESLAALSARHGLALVEDCAQAHGVRLGGTRVGTRGHFAAFSFYPTKNLGALGDAGMLLTDDAGLAARVGRLRQYGWQEPQRSEVAGWNSRLDPLQAAVLAVKLGRLEAGNARRRELAARYSQELAALPLELPAVRAGGEHVFHLYVLRCRDRATRDALRASLAGQGIQTAVHYPLGVHAQPAYAGRLRSGDLAETERVTATALSLPLYPELEPADQARVIAALRGFFGGGA